MYFARVDVLYRVLQVIIADQDFVDRLPGMWIPCDINGVEPKNYPGVGFKYNPDLNAFIAPKPYPSWSLDANCQWQAPVPIPDNQHSYYWNEDSQSWTQ